MNLSQAWSNDNLKELDLEEYDDMYIVIKEETGLVVVWWYHIKHFFLFSEFRLQTRKCTLFTTPLHSTWLKYWLNDEKNYSFKTWEEQSTKWNMSYIRFCFKTRMALAFTASWAGPGLVFLICSLYLASSVSSLLILSSTLSPLLFIWREKTGTENKSDFNCLNLYLKCKPKILWFSIIHHKLTFYLGKKPMKASMSG